MQDFDYDLFVIGGGSGGIRAARMSAQLGAKVMVAEKKDLGGTCVNVGCIPKKFMVYASHFAEDFRDAKDYGWDLDVKGFDWQTYQQRKDKEIARLNEVYQSILHYYGVENVFGEARIVGPNSVQVGDKTYTSKYILVATGGHPTPPNIPGGELGWISDDIFYLEKLPKDILIVGGGYIGVEFACILADFGVNVKIAFRAKGILRGFDLECTEVLAEEMIAKGITLQPEKEVVALSKSNRGLEVRYHDGTEDVFEGVLFATGRTPSIHNLGLEDMGVDLHPNGGIKVDSGYCTSVPSIFAVGDVSGGKAMTPVALAEGMALSKRLFSDEQTEVDYRYIPTAVFSQPPLATVGLSEEEALDVYGSVDVYHSHHRPLKYSLTDKEEKAFMKLVVDQKSQQVVGAHMVGMDAAEIVPNFAIPMMMGATKPDFDRAIGVHPTSQEEFVTMRKKTR